MPPNDTNGGRKRHRSLKERLKDVIVAAVVYVLVVLYYQRPNVELLDATDSTSAAFAPPSLACGTSNHSASTTSTSTSTSTGIHTHSHHQDDSITTSNMGASASTRQLSLDTLTASSYHTCPDGLIYVPNHLVANNVSTPRNETNTATSPLSSRRIPPIIHVTSKSRCLTPNFADNLKTWHFDQHNVYLHDDEAVERFFQWSAIDRNFPHLNLVRRCLRSGAGTADLWRYLMLWEYGGIYTDIDNAPGKLWNDQTIHPDDDAFFVVEKLGVLSQYFMAAAPRHPLMYFAVQVCLMRLLDLDHVGKQNIPVVTGPGALKVAFKYFMRTQEVLTDEEAQAWRKEQLLTRHEDNVTRYGRVKEGVYEGVGHRRVTVRGTKETGGRWVVRGSVDGKSSGYEQMGMRHFSKIAKKKFNESCLVHLWTMQEAEAMGEELPDFTNW